MGKIILVLIVFMVVMGFMIAGTPAGADPGLPFLGLMVGFYLLVWATLIWVVLGILKMLLRGATRVVRDEMDRQ
jgi:hypothetical protein